MSESIHIQCVESQPFAENTYIVWREGESSCLVIDPGFEPDLIFTVLEKHNLKVDAILNTHGHADHIGGNEAMKQAFPEAPLVIGKKDAVMLSDAQANLSAPFGLPITSPDADRLVSEGEQVQYANLDLDVLDIPGHSPGHVVFVLRTQPVRVFGGDVLFQGSVGRMDFPGGDGVLLKKGIREKLFQLPSDTIVYPGHGPTTTIGEEKEYNPFVGDHVG